MWSVIVEVGEGEVILVSLKMKVTLGIFYKALKQQSKKNVFLKDTWKIEWDHFRQSSAAGNTPRRGHTQERHFSITAHKV